MIAAGVIMGLVAALFGAIDWASIPAPISTRRARCRTSQHEARRRASREWRSPRQACTGTPGMPPRRVRLREPNATRPLPTTRSSVTAVVRRSSPATDRSTGSAGPDSIARR
jgi:hypothetical protein